MIVGSEIYMECLVRTTLKKKKSSKSKSKSKSRFSDEQIRSLEVMFESDTKLEAKKKAEVATQLGLQPRQVAIWFQNKRARWKSKHLENEFKVLLNNYNTLASQFESLKKDNLSLLTQIEELQKVKYKSSSDGESSADHDYSRSKNIIDHDGFHQVVKNNGVSSDDDDNDHGGTKSEFLGLMDDHDELLKMVEPHVADHDQDWGTLHLHSHDHDHDHLINQTSFQWWDFWS